jgi:arylsulfatase A-like enzyme
LLIVAAAAAQTNVFYADFEAAATNDHSDAANLNLGTEVGSWTDLRNHSPSYVAVRANAADSDRALLLDRIGVGATDGFAALASFSEPVSLTNTVLTFDTAIGRTVGDPDKNYSLVGEDANGTVSFHLDILGGTSSKLVAYTVSDAANVPVPLSTGAHLDPEVAVINGDSPYVETSMGRLVVATAPGHWTVAFDKNRDGITDWTSSELSYAGNAVSIDHLRIYSQTNTANNRSQAGAWLDKMSVTGIPFDGIVTNVPPVDPPPAAGTNWNVLMIAVDDLNDWIGVLGGHPQTLTPNMDRLAARGVVFAQAQTAAPECQPSRSALMAGIAPATSTLYDNGYPNFRSLPATQFATSLPQFLKNQGYRIINSGKIYHSTPDLPASKPTGVAKGATDWDDSFAGGLSLGDPGFDPNANTPGNNFGSLSVQKYAENYANVPVPWAPFVVYSSGTNIDHSAATLTAMREGMNDFRVARWVEGQIMGANTVTNPLFIAAGMTKPHLDWNVPINYYEKFPVESILLPSVMEGDLDDLSTLARNNGNTGDHLEILATADPDLAWRYAVRAYLATINFCDEAIGVMLDAVDARKVQFPDEKWMVVLWSDHGWHLGEKARWRKFTLWEESARSVMMYWMPGLTTPGSRVEVPTSHMDIYPTILDMLGYGIPFEVQGESEVPLMENPTLLADNFPVMSDGEGWQTIRTRRWRYIRYSDGSEELYDHYRDPQEWYNLFHPLNDARVYDAQSVTNAHRRILTELAKWSVKVNSSALFTSPLKFDIAAVPTLGRKRVDHFDAGPTDWTLQTAGGGFTTSAGVLEVPNGTKARMTADDLLMAAGEDLFVSVRVNFAAQGGSGGVLFDWQDEDNFYELRVVDGRAAGSDQDVDLRFVRRVGGVETNLIEIADLVNVGTTANQPPIAAGWFTVVAEYSAETGKLELWVARPDGVPYWRGEWTPAEPLAAGRRCGVAARDAGGMQLDDFIALSYVPVDIVSPDVVRVGDVGVDGGAFRFNWASTPDVQYRISSRPSLDLPWAPAATNIAATPPTNFYERPGAFLSAEFFKVDEGD